MPGTERTAAAAPCRPGRRGLLVALAWPGAAGAWAAALGLGLPAPARAHGAAAHAGDPAGSAAARRLQKEQTAWGIAGDARAVRRTVTVRMSDAMRFSPAHIDVRLGETLRLRVHNAGRVMHEFVLGTRAENARHAALMEKFPDMEHDAPHMAHVPPGQTGEIVWTFNRAGRFEFACLIPGHYPAGMVGTVQVTGPSNP